MKNLNQYIGETVKGVSFTSNQYRGIYYSPKMDKHIGHEGIITEYSEIGNTFRVEFETPVRDYWIYPAEVILPQLEGELIEYTIPQLEGELIGYTVNDEKYAKVIARLSNCSVRCLLKLTSEGVHFTPNSYIREIVAKYDLLDKCTPVFKQAEITLPKINGYNGEDKGDYIQYGCAQLLKSWFEKSENRSINSLELSSGVRIESKQMEEIRKYLESKK